MPHMNIQPQIVDLPPTSGKERRFVFVLLDNFTMLCFACAVESLRIANRMAGRTLYTWRLIGEGGQSVRCSNGAEFRVDMDLAEPRARRYADGLRRDRRAGRHHPPAAELAAARGAARRHHRRPLHSAHSLAKAGLLDGRKATIHWKTRIASQKSSRM